MNTQAAFLPATASATTPRWIHICPKRLCFVLLACMFVCAQAQEHTETGFKGDVGLAWMREETLNPAVSHEHGFIPYVYGDWGRWFARVDTFGIKTLPLGRGHLEVVYRDNNEGKTLVRSQTPHNVSRDNPQLWGLGTFQETSVGAFFVYGLHDARSNGQLFELTYVLEFQVAGATLYPQLGVQHRSASYVNKLYGVSAKESAALGLASYTPAASTSYVWSLALELPLQAHWNLEWEISHTRLGSTLSQSPLVSKSSTVSNLIALVRHF